VAAWRHVVDRFRAAGATNVLWVWILGSEVFREGTADGWYPGRSYVDYAGADGYNYDFAIPGAQWRTVDALFSSFYAWSVQHHLPAMITETGCLEDPADPGRKAAWFNNADAWLHTHPDIRAFVYFNTTVRWPWWVDTSAESLAAFRALANDPRLR
jgi:beta-mannanase